MGSVDEDMGNGRPRSSEIEFEGGYLNRTFPRTQQSVQTAAKKGKRERIEIKLRMEGTILLLFLVYE
ncbi:hypothetical protein QQP08_015977 [Theobroma cacao]|nr:hypothetical protein QQP08_015977 [Theobroma cacao]